MKSYLVLLGFLYMVSLPRECYSILLCDSDCRNNPLEICRDIPKNKTLLSVMALFPCNVPGYRGRGLTVAAQMAVQKIANEPNLLSGYILKLQVDNTMVRQMERQHVLILCTCNITVTHSHTCTPIYTYTHLTCTQARTTPTSLALYIHKSR